MSVVRRHLSIIITFYVFLKLQKKILYCNKELYNLFNFISIFKKNLILILIFKIKINFYQLN